MRWDLDWNESPNPNQRWVNLRKKSSLTITPSPFATKATCYHTSKLCDNSIMAYAKKIMARVQIEPIQNFDDLTILNKSLG